MVLAEQFRTAIDSGDTNVMLGLVVLYGDSTSLGYRLLSCDPAETRELLCNDEKPFST